MRFSGSKKKMATQTHIMNMSRPKSQTRPTASTISTFFIPVKKKLQRKSSRGTNALYRAISAEEWELVVSICESKPYKAEKWHNALGFFDAHRSSKILPLHQACIFHPPRDAIKHIIQAYPYALRSKESGYGRVPLHIACHSNAAHECIQDLLSHYPAASVDRDLIGRVPLHFALSNGATFEIVEDLINAAAQTYNTKAFGRQAICSTKDFNGWLPIHVACFMGAPARVISLLVKSYPEGVDTRTNKNSTPVSLLRSITISPDKRSELEAILSRKKKQSVKYAARISPARTDIEKVVRMSDETCSFSKGVTLEIDEDETSSLSSMDTLRTGKTKNKIAVKKQLQFGADATTSRRKVDGGIGVGVGGTARPGPPPQNQMSRLDQHQHQHANLHPNGNINIDNGRNVGNPFTNTPISTAVTRTALLPTHAVYGENPNIITDHSEIPPQGGGIQSQSAADVMFAPSAKPVRRSVMNAVRSVTESMSKSSISTPDSANNGVVFQSVNSTAVFC